LTHAPAIEQPKQQALANTNRAVALPAIVPNSVAELIALADTLYKGGIAPKGCTRPEVGRRDHLRGHGNRLASRPRP
jgi:hypothetical protein